MPKIATIGFFDGVHKGHRYLFEQLDKLGVARGLSPLIVTFEEHPRALLQSDYVPCLLTTKEERKALLNAYGEVLMFSFEQIHSRTARQFMQLLHDTYDVSVLLMGYDHRFGSDCLHRFHDYRQAGEKAGVEVLQSKEFTEGEWHISSTEIRAALEHGNIALANDLLGRPYTLKGTVVHGKGIGRTIGFPTANIQPVDPHSVIPHAGVYAVEVHAYAFTWTSAMLNIDTNGTIEVHIPSFQGDLYDQTLEIRFKRFIREERQFASLDELQQQIRADVDNSHYRG